MKVLSLFSGIGAFEQALENLQIPHEVVNYCEIDRYAARAYSLLHGVSEDKNLGDITKVDPKMLPEFDLMTYGFPCQDISVAGKQAGISEGTRSGLLSYALKIIQEKRPKYAICENVKNLVGRKFRKDFENLLAELESYGYVNHWKVLNAKDYGIPQNRERVFVVSIRDDLKQDFEFPLPFDNGLRLKDLLEETVDERYYLPEEKCRKLLEELKDKQISNTVRAGGRGSIDRHQWDLVCVPVLTPDRLVKRQNGRRFKTDGEPAFTLNTQDRHGVMVLGKVEAINNDMRSRVYNIDGISPTLNTCQGGNNEPKVYLDYRIRKLTPLECFRLQGFSDESYTVLKDNNISNSQLYKMAGNSIVVDVLEGIFKGLFRLS